MPKSGEKSEISSSTVDENLFDSRSKYTTDSKTQRRRVERSAVMVAELSGKPQRLVGPRGELIVESDGAITKVEEDHD